MLSTSLSNEDLFFLNTTENFQKKKLALQTEGRCLQCFLTKQLCICSEVKNIFSKSEMTPKANLLVYMHYKEWGRSSNTGKLLLSGLPSKSQLHLYGIREDQKNIVDSLLSKPSIIVYPSRSAVSIQEFKEWYSLSEDINVCVIDSTWSQSYAMDQSLPTHIPRVKVDDFVVGASQFLNRKQSDLPGRVSTIEAAAIALKTLGEPDAALAPIYQALHLSVDAVLRQRGKKTAYGHDFMAQISNPTEVEEGLSGPYTKATILRPQACPLCGASQQHTVFKNMGVRSKVSTEDIRKLTNEENADEKHRRLWKCQACLEFFA